MNPFPDAPADAPKAPAGGLVAGQTVGAGRFRLERPLGQGGMGVVWLAQDRLLREPVALKFLPPQIAFDPAALRGLRREALRARKLSHPNLVRIHDLIDAPDEPPFICMEFVDGPTLHTLRASSPAQVLAWDFLRPLAGQLCAALEYAHGEKVIHRDIKPANLMLDRSGRLKLADFGLARVVSDSMSRLSEQSNTSGTLGYMSPQQADGRPPRVTDDIYSLGATFYELLTSTPPFHSGDISHQLRHQPPQPPADRLAQLELNNAVPTGVSALILDCLAKEDGDRPQNARAVLQRLDSSAIVTPAESRRPRVRAKRFAVAAMLALLGAVAMAWRFTATSSSDKAQESISRPDDAANLSPSQPNLTDGFQTIFNGRDLTGWDGDTNLWHVRDGVIAAFTTEEGITRRENTCLIWREPVRDFELRLQFRMNDVISAKPANSGVLYRARRLEDWRVQGYQCDLHGDYAGTLLLLWDTLSDPRSPLGQAASLQQTNGRTVFKSINAVASAKELKARIKKDGWNELVITAQGNRLVHQINGVTTCEVTDHRSSERDVDGCLALELKRATHVQFKDIRLKHLRDGASASTARPGNDG